MASKSDMVERFGPFNNPQIAVMLGGNNKRYGVSSSSVEKVANDVFDYAQRNNARLIIIPSRRTPKKARMLFEKLDKDKKHIFWDGEHGNPYPNIFSIADEIIVTSDSVNMVTEACLFGRPVIIAHWEKEQGRLAKFHEIMNKNGYTIPLSKAGEPFEPKILNQMPQIAKKIDAILNR